MLKKHPFTLILLVILNSVVYSQELSSIVEDSTSTLKDVTKGSNKREMALADILAKRTKDHSVSTSGSTITTNAFSKSKRGVKKDAADSINTAVYRRSSLYTLMIDNPVRKYAMTIKNTFGNTDIPEKF
ncbi:MAG: hypothetical protein ACPGU9_09340, partial [Flavobacteriaceae bacterium]